MHFTTRSIDEPLSSSGADFLQRLPLRLDPPGTSTGRPSTVPRADLAGEKDEAAARTAGEKDTATPPAA